MFRFFLLATLTAGLAFGAEEKKEKPAPNSDSETVTTPFGPAKRQAQSPKAEPRPVTSKPLVDVSLQGDTYTFTRKTPFGSQSWKRSKADLSANEKKLVADHEAWEKYKAEQAKPTPPPADKPQS